MRDSNDRRASHKNGLGDSDAYKARKRALRKQLTIYGRKPVLEALQDNSLDIRRLHLADSNRPAAILDEISSLAAVRDVPVQTHAKVALSRISRNAKQDQGVALDIAPPGFRLLEELTAEELAAGRTRFVLCDGISNPQNLGMIARSVAAAGITGLVLPLKGNASVSPLVIKASAGALFHCPVLLADTIESAIDSLQSLGVALYILDSSAKASIFTAQLPQSCAFVLGSESEGPGDYARRKSDGSFSIPMANGVESLNVAVSAALVAFLTVQ